MRSCDFICLFSEEKTIKINNAVEKVTLEMLIASSKRSFQQECAVIFKNITLMKINVLVFILLLSGCVSTHKAACDLDNTNRAIVMNNIWVEMDKRYPGHSVFCAVSNDANQFRFYSEKGECRVYLPCGESDEKGQTLLHGDWIVSFDSISSEVHKFYDVAW